jgi:hypothetical protein
MTENKDHFNDLLMIFAVGCQNTCNTTSFALQFYNLCISIIFGKSAIKLVSDWLRSRFQKLSTFLGEGREGGAMY